MTVPVVWLSYGERTPARGYWDQGVLECLFSHELWRPVGAHEFEHLYSLEGLGGAVVVLPARSQAEFVEQLQRDIERLKWVVLMLTGDEEAIFPLEKLSHPNMRLWVMSPRKSRTYPEGTRYLGTGFPPQARLLLTKYDQHAVERPIDYFFAGQITHERRLAMVAAVHAWRETDKQTYGEVFASAGFTEGLVPEVYYKKLAGSKIAFAPSGPQTPDTFRLFEALEAGCIPIADCRVPSDNDNTEFGDDYWTWFFGEEPPFPVLSDYEQLQGYTREALDNWRPLANRTFAWWMRKKRQMAYWLESDLAAVGAPDYLKEGVRPGMADLVTVLIPTSPIRSHPDTAMIEQTIRDVRSKLPESEIIIMVDGVRPEQEHYRAAYEEYTRKLLWLAHHEWHNVMVLLSEHHQHQARMTRAALNHVATPTILFVEHDAPITPDCNFEWDGLLDAIMQGDANVIRFHHEARVLPEHEHLMLGPVEHIRPPWENPAGGGGTPMRKTMQWSQRPHLASTAFYRQMLDKYFHPDSKTMIEDVIHGAVIEDCRKDSIMGWYSWRLGSTTPRATSSGATTWTAAVPIPSSKWW